MGMDYLAYQLGSTLGLVIGGFLLLGIFSAITSTFRGHWSAQRMVLRGHKISFEPHPAGEPVNSYVLSDQAEALVRGDPKFAIVIGRPAGLINFLREGIGLARRLEFVLGKENAAFRLDSFTTNIQVLVKVRALDSIAVSWVRPNILKLILINLLLGVPTGIGLLFTLPITIYWWVTQREVRVELSSFGKAELIFFISPPFLERLTGRPVLAITQEDTSRLVQIFRVIKDS